MEAGLGDLDGDAFVENEALAGVVGLEEPCEEGAAAPAGVEDEGEGGQGVWGGAGALLAKGASAYTDGTAMPPSSHCVDRGRAGIFMRPRCRLWSACGGQGPGGILGSWITAGTLARSGLGSVNGVLLVFIAVVIIVIGGHAAGGEAVQREAGDFCSGFAE